MRIYYNTVSFNVVDGANVLNHRVGPKRCYNECQHSKANRQADEARTKCHMFLNNYHNKNIDFLMFYPSNYFVSIHLRNQIRQTKRTNSF